MLTRKTLIYILLILFINACLGKSNTNIQQVKVKISEVDILKHDVRSEFVLIKLNLTNDTLSIVSTNQFLYYPFGAFKDIQEFEGHFSKMFTTDSINNLGNLLFIESYKNSLIEFFKDKEKNKLEVVSAKIFDNEIILNNGIEVGISKMEFLLKFFKNVSQKLYHQIDIIKMESGLIGICHYYVFKEDKLFAIYFSTDYQFEHKYIPPLK